MPAACRPPGRATRAAKDAATAAQGSRCARSPSVGIAPPACVFTAELTGGANDFEDFYCPSDRVGLGRRYHARNRHRLRAVRGRQERDPPAVLQYAHVFQRAGSYQVYFRLKRGDRHVGDRHRRPSRSARRAGVLVSRIRGPADATSRSACRTRLSAGVQRTGRLERYLHVLRATQVVRARCHIVTARPPPRPTIRCRASTIGRLGEIGRRRNGRASAGESGRSPRPRSPRARASRARPDVIARDRGGTDRVVRQIAGRHAPRSIRTGDAEQHAAALAPDAPHSRVGAHARA